MTVLKQFSSLLNEKIDDDDLKVELTEAFTKVEGVFSEAIASRDKVKDSNKSLTTLKSEIAELMGFDAEFTASDIKAILEAKNSSKDLDALKEELTTKYEGDLETLRGELSTKDDSYMNLQTKYNDSLFNSAIVNGGLLDGFVDEPMARQNIVGMIKDNLLYEDGNVYVKDGVSGDKAKDIKTGEYLSASSVVDNLKSTINPMYLAGEVKANSSNTPNNQNSQKPSAGIEPGKYTDVNQAVGDAFADMIHKV